MALYTIPQRLKHRRGTYTELYARNETLLAGEECFETHDSAGVEHNPWKCKVGDGETPWNDLEYEATGSGGTTDIAAEIHAATSKTTPVDADELGLVDSAASNVLKKLTWANLKATAKTYFDTLYRAVGTAIGTSDLANDAVTYAKLQDVSATSRILGRKTSGSGDAEECTLSEVLDFIGSAAQGDILYRDSSGWARLPAGTSGKLLKTQGAGANPTWATIAGVTGGLSYVTGVTAGASAQVLTTPTIDLATDKMYLVFVRIKNGQGGSANYSLYYNSDTTAANYSRQSMNPNNTAIGLARASDAIIFTTSATGGVGDSGFGIIEIAQDPAGRARAHVRINTDITIRGYYTAHAPTTAYNVTSITLSGNSTDTIGVGTSIEVYKVTP